MVVRAQAVVDAVCTWSVHVVCVSDSCMHALLRWFVCWLLACLAFDGWLAKPTAGAADCGVLWAADWLTPGPAPALSAWAHAAAAASMHHLLEE